MCTSAHIVLGQRLTNADNAVHLLPNCRSAGPRDKRLQWQGQGQRESESESDTESMNQKFAPGARR